MSLIHCPECDKEISDKVKDCPHCGFPLEKNEDSIQKVEISSVKLKKMKPKNKKITLISIFAVVAVVIITIAGLFIIGNINNSSDYTSAVELLDKGKSKEAMAAFKKLGNFKDSPDKVNEIRKAIEDELITSITTAADNSYRACSTILTVWEEAGVDRDFNQVFKYMFSGDISNHAWSGLGMDTSGFSTISWGRLAIEMNNFHKTLSSLENEKVNTDKLLDDFNNIQSSNSNQILSYYNAYLKLYNAAHSPSGNRLNYSSNLVSYRNELDTAKTTVNSLNKYK